MDELLIWLSKMTCHLDPVEIKKDLQTNIKVSGEKIFDSGEELE
jgi:hypothetical protein